MKYLIGYDGSNVAKAALELSRSYAKKLNAEVVVLASVEGGTVTHDIEVAEAKKNLEYAKKFLEEKDISVETKLLVRGYRPGEDIVKFISENDIQTVFIGIRRRSKLDKMIFGSNASYILLNAPCPVIAVK